MKFQVFYNNPNRTTYKHSFQANCNTSISFQNLCCSLMTLAYLSYMTYNQDEWGNCEFTTSSQLKYITDLNRFKNDTANQMLYFSDISFFKLK